MFQRLTLIRNFIFQAKVSLGRLQKFVNAEELDPDNVDRTPRAGPAISIEDGTFAWEKDADPTLQKYVLVAATFVFIVLVHSKCSIATY